MSFFTRMNSKLDEGWKLSNINCEKCKSSVLIQPVTNYYYCPKCDVQTTEPITVKYEVDSPQLTNQNDHLSDDSEEDSGKIAQAIFNKPSKSDEYSKKLSQKLLQGWAMLDEVCEDCLIPIMKSKAGKKVCVGCEGMKKEQIKPENPKQQEQVAQPIKQVEPKPQEQIQKAFTVTKTLVSVFAYYDIKIAEAIQKDDPQRIEELTEKLLKLCIRSVEALPGIKFD